MGHASCEWVYKCQKPSADTLLLLRCNAIFCGEGLRVKRAYHDARTLIHAHKLDEERESLIMAPNLKF